MVCADQNYLDNRKPGVYLYQRTGISILIMKTTFFTLDSKMAKIEAALREPVSVRQKRPLIQRLARLKRQQAEILATKAA